MTFILNKCYGGWSISKEVKEMLNLDTVYPTMSKKLETDLTALINKYGSKFCSGKHAKLKVVEIPDNCTDYEINDYDGIETITYVVDGKIYHA